MSSAIDDADNEIVEQALGVILRLHEAEYARFEPFELRMQDGTSWTPSQHSCHSNVATIVYCYPNLRHVAGYLVLSPEMTGAPHWIVAAHSLVEVEAKKGLLEVTPGAGTETLPFIRHTGPEQHIQKFRDVVNVHVSPEQVAAFVRR